MTCGGDIGPATDAAASNARRTSPPPCTGLSPARWITRGRPGSPPPLTGLPPPMGGSRRMRRVLEGRTDRDRDPLPGRRLLVGGGGRDRRSLLGQTLDDHLDHLADVAEHL